MLPGQLLREDLQELLKIPIRLSIASPAYNEAEGIYSVVTQWRDYLLNHADVSEFEIVICNDGSTDETGLILDYLHTQYPDVRPYHLPKNKGAAFALKCAIKETRFDWVLLLDADNQFPIENLDKLLTKIRNEVTVAALGVRQKKDGHFAVLGSKVSGQICNWLHGARLADFNSACKLVFGPLLRSLMLEARGMNYSTEITSRLLEAKASITQVDIEHRPRLTGKSKMKLIQGSLHRLLFVFYIAFRQLLLKLEIIHHP